MLSGVMEISTDLYRKLLVSTIKNGKNLVVFGQKGIGKTEIPMETARSLEFDIVYWNLSTQEAPDLIGFPIIKDEGGYATTEYASPRHMPIPELFSKKVVVIVDEVDKAKSELQNPLLEILQFHTINGRPLNIQAIILTGNLPDEHAFSKPVSHALTNRCKVYKLIPDFDNWRDNFAIKNGVDPLFVGFLSKNPEYLCKPTPEDMTAYTSCTPRSWTKCSEDFECHKNDDEDFLTAIIAGHVGTEASIKFKVWLTHYRHIEPHLKKIVEGKSVSISKLTIDKQFILAVSACGEISRKIFKKEKKDLVSVTKNVFSFLSKLPTEMQIAATKSSLTNEMIFENKLDEEVPELRAVFYKINEKMKKV